MAVLAILSPRRNSCRSAACGASALTCESYGIAAIEVAFYEWRHSFLGKQSASVLSHCA